MKNIILALLFVTTSGLVMSNSRAEDVKSGAWQEEVKTEYNLTDEQVKYLQDKGITGNDAVRIASFTKTSGKTLEEVAAMRSEKKMGWGAIAKELGIHPSEIGHSVSRMHKKEKHENHGKHEMGERHGDKGGGKERGHSKK